MDVDQHRRDRFSLLLRSELQLHRQAMKPAVDWMASVLPEVVLFKDGTVVTEWPEMPAAIKEWVEYHDGRLRLCREAFSREQVYLP